MFVHPAHQILISLLGRFAKSEQKILLLTLQVGAWKSDAHVVRNARLAGRVDHPVRKFGNEYSRLKSRTAF